MYSVLKKKQIVPQRLLVFSVLLSNAMRLFFLSEMVMIHLLADTNLPGGLRKLAHANYRKREISSTGFGVLELMQRGDTQAHWARLKML